MVERAKFAPERSEPKRTINLVTEGEAAVAILEPKIAQITTPMPNPVSATTS